MPIDAVMIKKVAGIIKQVNSLMPRGIYLSITNKLVLNRLVKRDKAVVIVVKKDGRFPYVLDIPTPEDFERPDSLYHGEPYGAHFINTMASKDATIVVVNGSVKKVKPRKVILGMMSGELC